MMLHVNQNYFVTYVYMGQLAVQNTIYRVGCYVT